MISSCKVFNFLIKSSFHVDIILEIKFLFNYHANRKIIRDRVKIIYFYSNVIIKLYVILT